MRKPSPQANSKFILRPYQPADFERLWQLDQSCFAQGIAYTKGELLEFLQLPGASTIVAEDDTNIQGFILTHLDKRTAHIITIDVRTDQRRTGLGSQLLQAAESTAIAAGCAAVLLEVAVDNIPALTFYKRHGFTVLRTIPRYYNNSIDALRMGKDLATSSST